jgi:hypothetical protein
MFSKTAITLFGFLALTVSAASAQTQFAPALGPPAGPVPTGPSRFPPITIPAPPPGWSATTPIPHATPAGHGSPSHNHVFRVYYRRNNQSHWIFFAHYNQRSGAESAVRFLRSTGNQAMYN